MAGNVSWWESGDGGEAHMVGKLTSHINLCLINMYHMASYMFIFQTQPMVISAA
jgi:hypothetical protein